MKYLIRLKNLLKLNQSKEERKIFIFKLLLILFLRMLFIQDDMAFLTVIVLILLFKDN